MRDILVRNFLFVVIYVWLHFTIQLLYQFDWLCLPQQRNGNFSMAEYGETPHHWQLLTHMCI